MRTRYRTATATATVTAVLLIVSGPAAAANGSSGTDVATILRHTKAFTDTQHSDPATSRSEVATVTPDNDGGNVSLTRKGVTISFTLPGSHNAPRKTAEVGGAQYDNESYSTVVQGGATGARTVLVMKNSTAPSSYRFHMNVPPGYTLRRTGDGKAAVVQNKSTGDAAVIMPPWAVDAAGKSVPTSYTVIGNDLTLIVNPAGATFPVVADPDVQWQWWGYSSAMSRQETNDFAYAAQDVAAGYAGCAALGGYFTAGMLALACGIEGMSYWWMADDAGLYYSHGNCITLNMTWASVWWSDEIQPGTGNCW